MSELRFIEDDNRGLPRKARVSGPKSSFAAFLIRKGLVKSERQANILMVILALIMAGAIVYININTFSSPVVDEDSAVIL
ncbi:hypothetical protein K2Q16_00680 [Patescibacteria group bacterium]|nr:hypothetical protein [Patescibacteria group bacterium]